jgi:hypothetical protein
MTTFRFVGAYNRSAATYCPHLYSTNDLYPEDGSNMLSKTLISTDKSKPFDSPENPHEKYKK